MRLMGPIGPMRTAHHFAILALDRPAPRAYDPPRFTQGIRRTTNQPLTPGAIRACRGREVAAPAVGGDRCPTGSDRHSRPARRGGLRAGGARGRSACFGFSRSGYAVDTQFSGRAGTAPAATGGTVDGYRCTS